MSNFLSRLLIMLIFLPLLFLLIFIFNFENFLLFNILVVLVTVIASCEVVQMFRRKKIPIFRLLAPIFSATLPLVMYLSNCSILPPSFIDFWLALVFILLFCSVLFFQNILKIDEALPGAAASVFSMLYPGFFLMYIVKISFFPQAEVALIYFLASVFLNDIAAYCFGKLANGKTRLNLTISPNKTLIGFIGGFLTSIATFMIFSFVFKDYYYLPWSSAMAIGSILGLTTIVGDLFESALKRSCQIKDSGVIMGGRGGLMDAIDSLLFSAPIFYYLFSSFARPVL